MAARRIRRAHHGRLWRPARVATPTSPTTGPARPHSRQPVPPAAAQHQARPGRPPHAARAPPPALTPAPPRRPGRRSGATLTGRNPGGRAASTHKPHRSTRKGAGQQPQIPTARGGVPGGPRRCCRSRNARGSCPSHAQPQRSPGAREGHQAWRGCAQPDRDALRRPAALPPARCPRARPDISHPGGQQRVRPKIVGMAG
jgi:hypothetical protein